jgi:hypothetical protein
MKYYTALYLRCEKSSVFVPLIVSCKLSPLHVLGFSLGLLFKPKDGEMFLRNVGWLSTDYTAIYPGKHNPSYVRISNPA